ALRLLAQAGVKDLCQDQHFPIWGRSRWFRRSIGHGLSGQPYARVYCEAVRVAIRRWDLSEVRTVESAVFDLNFSLSRDRVVTKRKSSYATSHHGSRAGAAVCRRASTI